MQGQQCTNMAEHGRNQFKTRFLQRVYSILTVLLTTPLHLCKFKCCDIASRIIGIGKVTFQKLIKGDLILLSFSNEFLPQIRPEHLRKTLIAKQRLSCLVETLECLPITALSIFIEPTTKS